MAVMTGKNKSSQKAREFEDVGRKKSILPLVLSLLVLVLLIGSAVAILVFDAFSIRENFLRGILYNVPGLNLLLDEEVPEQAPLTMVDLQNEIAIYRSSLESMQNDLATSNSRVSELMIENNSLNERAEALEAELAPLLAVRDELIPTAISENPEIFMNIFETLHPEEAIEIYESLLIDSIASGVVTEYLLMFQGMSARNAAAILTGMMGDNQVPLVANIIQNLPLQSQIDIMSALDTEYSSLIATLIAPQFN